MPSIIHASLLPKMTDPIPERKCENPPASHNEFQNCKKDPPSCIATYHITRANGGVLMMSRKEPSVFPKPGRACEN